ncbi:MAG: glycoside hydrolase family 3 N-terminal domain-containing protein [Terriglobales bacterium]|jgi:beta-N-acetylhexosaminidase
MRIANYLLTAFCLLALALPLRAADRSTHAGTLHKVDNQWVEKTLHKMSDEEKVGQLFMVWVRAQFLNVNSSEYRDLVEQINRYHLGSLAMSIPIEGPFLIRSQPYDAAILLNKLQQQSKLPLLIAADFESGLSADLDGPTVFPPAMAFGAAGKPEYAEAFGKITGQEARAIGVHWNFFPVADVNSNPANPIINTRSFGEDPEQVADMVAAYIRGAHSSGMLATAKHFPGHGDTAMDSHLGVAKVSGNRQRLGSVELPPFQKAIAAGVDAVMVAHVSVPALEPDPNRVATTSPAVVTQLLQAQLGFHGIVVTDALDMAGITRLYASNIGRASVDAFKAGNDVLLIPPDLDASYRAMIDAVKTGEISRARLDDSVRKILEAKAALGLPKSRLVDIAAIGDLVATPENVALGQRVADDAITLVRENGKVLPLRGSKANPSALPYQASEAVHNRIVIVIVSDDVRLPSGNIFEDELHARVPDAHVFYVDSRVAAANSPEILKAAQEAEQVVVAVYAVPVPGLRSVGAISADPTGILLQQILDRAAPKTMVVAVGNPYLAQDFPGIGNYLCTFSAASVSEMSAVKALFGEIPIHGRLPVTIPNIAPRGQGIDRPRSQK